MRLLLHIGQGKAGSTAIQTVLRANAPRLRGMGVLFPETGNHTNHQDIFTYLTGDVKHHDPRLQGARADARKTALGKTFLEAALKEIQASQPDLVILSCENQFRPFSQAALERLTGLLAPHFDTIDTCAYLRDPASFFLSYAQQDLKKRPDFTIPSRSYYRDTLDPWQRFGPGPVQCALFDRSALAEQDVVTDFCTRFAGIDGAHLSRDTAEENTTFSAEGMDIMQRFMRGEIAAPTRYHRMRPQRMKALVEAADRSCSGYTRPGLHKALRADLMARAQDLDWLDQSFGVTFAQTGAPAPSPEDADRRVRALDRVADICTVDPDRLQQVQSKMIQLAAPQRGVLDLFQRRPSP